jgi:hypothetical protein
MKLHQPGLDPDPSRTLGFLLQAPMSLPIRVLALALTLLHLSGCASFGRGLAEGVLESSGDGEDTRLCHIKGRAFEGLQSYLDRQRRIRAAGHAPPPVLKVLMVHGIGSHRPGYGTRLAENLAEAMRLDATSERFKQFSLSSLEWPGQELGTLRVSRYFNQPEDQVMLFYELTWDPIVEAEKQTISYDNSGEYSYRRAAVNELMKKFVNDTVPDVMTYQGSSRGKIQSSVSQAMCWMFSADWQGLPAAGVHRCEPGPEGLYTSADDDFAFVSHSLGSRVVIDSIQRLFQIVNSPEHAELKAGATHFKTKRYPIFMLSNQLPLLQLGRESPQVHGRIDAYCAPDGPKREQRFTQETQILAFSDPNDVMSYSIPYDFLDRYVDSRLCPTMTNVIINVAPVTNLFGLGQIASPLEAHTEYDNDDRVIALMVHGIGGTDVDPLIAERCTWMEARQ